MKKMKTALWLAVISICGLQLCACRLQKAEAKESAAVTAVPGEEKGTDPVLMWEEASALLEQGNCYEITENPYIEGIDFDFSREDIGDLKEIFGRKDFQYSEMTYEPEKAKYMIHFYDQDGGNLISFTLMEDGKLYMDGKHGGYQVSSEDLEALLNRRIEERSNKK